MDTVLYGESFCNKRQVDCLTTAEGTYIHCSSAAISVPFCLISYPLIFNSTKQKPVRVVRTAPNTGD